MTMLEATESGWWYSARVPGDRVAVAFATDAEEVRRGSLGREEQWITRLRDTRHIAARLVGCRFIGGSLVLRPGPTYRLDQPSGRRWLAVGDAACAFDPLAGQGIYKALSDGIAAAKTLVSALERDTELSSDFSDRIVAAFEEYRTNRNYFYGEERRWPAASFWQNRHERTALAPVPIG
jgi:flavin-dependent dehydrogenase